MLRLKLASFLIVVAVCTASLAQVGPIPLPLQNTTTGPPANPDGKAKKSESPPNGASTVGARSADESGIPGEVDIHFLNNSIVRMIVRSENLDVATQYGKLSVPVKDIVAIDFGVHFPEGVADKIELAIKNLGSNSYPTREAATRTLLEFGTLSYPAVYEATRDKDTEISGRAQGILKALKAKYSKADLKPSVDDRVMTANFTIVGRILNPTIKAQTEYFGEAELNLAKMRILRSVGGMGQDTNVSVDAFKYSTDGQWMDTKFRSNGRTTLVITAKGIIDTFPQQAGQYMAGPNGNPNGRNAGFFVKGGRIGAINAQQHGGMLLGKIGEEGEVFFVGERYEGTPEAEGNLFLMIGPSPWNCASSGSYEVHISRKH